MPRGYPSADLVKGRAAGIFGRIAEVLFDPQQLVVFGNTVRAAKAAGLDLPCIGRNSQVSNEIVLGLAGAMRDDRSHVVRAGKLDSIKRFGQRSYLVHLDKDRVCRPFFDAPLKKFY